MIKDNYEPESDENGKPPKFFQIQRSGGQNFYR